MLLVYWLYEVDTVTYMHDGDKGLTLVLVAGE